MKKCTLLFTGSLLIINLFAQPTITSFSPSSGPIGTIITISGIGFNTTAANNIVYFGAVKATVFDGTDSTLIVTVPVGITKSQKLNQ